MPPEDFPVAELAEHLPVAGLPWCMLQSEAQHPSLASIAGYLLQNPAEGVVPMQQALQPREPLPLPCQECVHSPLCPGARLPHPPTRQEAVQRLQPEVRVCSNAFNYRVAPLEQAALPQQYNECFVYRKERSVDACRNIFIHHQNVYYRGHTDTGDYDDSSVRDIREQTGQVYWDASDKALLDDFAADIRKLTPWPGCDECPRHPECCHLFTVSDADVFTADEQATVHPHFHELSGRIADIGCGSLRYREHLLPVLEADGTTFTAVEPSPEPELRAFLADHAAQLIEAPWEQAALPDDSHDWLLVMRSWNHLERLGFSIMEMKRVLRPGGRLLITENAPFGLARTDEQLQRLEHAPRLPFEHYRNHTSQQARAWLEACGFTVLTEHPLGPTTSNQWALIAQKPDE